MAIDIEQEVIELLETLEQDIPGWVNTAISYYVHPPAPHVGSTLEQVIMSQARNYGPSPRTGGQLHEVTLEQATVLANLIRKYAPASKPDSFATEEEWEACIIAGLAGESCCDPNAINPNWQDAVPGETPAQAFGHMDIGEAQFDGSTLTPNDEIFADLKGLSQDEIKAKALDPDWATAHYITFVARLFSTTKAEVVQEPSILHYVPEGDIRVLTYEAYNAGVRGSKLIAEGKGLQGDWSYGQNWNNRTASYYTAIKPT
jgi:hypothetical protein